MTDIPNPKRIEELELELKRLRDDEAKFNGLPDDQRLATVLHAKLCKSNHTDQCGWFYGEAWGRPERRHWLSKAQDLLATGKSYAELIEIINLMH